MRIKPFQGVLPKIDQIASIETFFNTVKEAFPRYSKVGLFQESAPDAIYIYQIQGPVKKYTGLLACSSIQDYIEGKIKKHEHTIPEKEVKQLQLLQARRAVVKPVLLTYPNVPKIDKWLASYTQSHPIFFQIYFEQEDQHHFLWQIKELSLIQELQSLFKDAVPYTYIADGHHRSSVAALYYKQEPTNHPIFTSDHTFLSAFFSFSEIDIMDFNRVIEGFGGVSKVDFLKKLSSLFSIKPLDKAEKPANKYQINLYIDKQWYRLNWKKENTSQINESSPLLDIELLNEKVLKGILNITNIRTDPRIKYVEGPKGLREIIKQTDKLKEGLAFCLFPIQLSELVKKADAQEVLPPKSTWIEPRMKNGLIVQKLSI